MRLKQPLYAAGLLLSAASFNSSAALTSYTAGNVGLVYSSISDVTWTQDANLFKTLYDSNNNLVNLITAVTPSYNDPGYGLQVIGDGGAIDDFDTSNGSMTWWGGIAFINYLNSINFGGSNQWAMPSAGANPIASYNQTNTTFGQLFYTELGGTADGVIPNTSTFDNEHTSMYWLGTAWAHGRFSAWSFNALNGSQIPVDKFSKVYVWAVSPGQVTAVPVPGAMWLMGSGLLGLLGLKRRGHAG